MEEKNNRIEDITERKTDIGRVPRFHTSHAVADASVLTSQQVQIEEEYRTKEHLSIWLSLDEIEIHFNRSIRCFFLFIQYVLVGLAINTVFAAAITSLRIYFLWQQQQNQATTTNEHISVWYWMSVSMQSSQLRYYMYVFSPLSTCIGFAVPFVYSRKLRRMKESEDITSQRFDYRSFVQRYVTMNIHGGGANTQNRTPVDIVGTHRARTQTRLYPTDAELCKSHVSRDHVALEMVKPQLDQLGHVHADICAMETVSLENLPSIAPPITETSAKMIHAAHRVHQVNKQRETQRHPNQPIDAPESVEPTSCCERIKTHLSSVYAYDRARIIYMIKPLLSYAFSFIVGAGFLVAQIFTNIQLLHYTDAVGDLMLTFLLSCISMALYMGWTYTAECLTNQMEHHDSSDGRYQSYFIKIFVYRLGSTLILFFVTHTFFQDNASSTGSTMCPYTSLTQQYISELISQIVFAVLKTFALHIYRIVVVHMFRKKEYSDLEWIPTFVLEEEIINLLYLLFLYLYGLHVFPLLSLCSLVTIGALSIIIRYRLFKICKLVDKGLQKSFRKSLMLANSLNVLAAFWFGFLTVVLGYSSEVTDACLTA